MKWIDRNKQDAKNPLYRSRLVGQEFNTYNDITLYAATPPLEAKRMLFSRAATQRKDGKWRSLMFIDAKKAHLNPKCEDDVYIDLPEEVGAGKG